jgi:hypothetical protein
VLQLTTLKAVHLYYNSHNTDDSKW